MDARQAVLRRLRAARRPADHPPPWRSRRHFDDLAERFAQVLTAAHGEVRRAADVEGAVEHLWDLLAEVGARRVLLNREPPLDRLNLPDRRPDLEWFVVGHSPATCAPSRHRPT
ncbi:MAG: hypothetical protein Q9O62_12775 [Ardenticatenia bacterium]|nr:hypothetical protein [Ardenticatenia bacterium]